MSDELMNDEHFRERLSAMDLTEIADLNDATADDCAALGITKEVFTHNMSVKSDYDAEVRPLKLV